MNDAPLSGYTISLDAPPNSTSYIAYWERSSDPFHVSALPKLDDKTISVTIGGQFTQGPQTHGWLAIDWIENPVGYVADGTVWETEPCEYIMKVGPYGHLCAYKNDEHGLHMMKSHEGQDWRKK